LHQMAKLKYVVVIEQHSTFPNKMTSSIIWLFLLSLPFISSFD
jgi:hypothetical protein